MNEFYNLLLKFIYLVSLSYKEKLLSHQIEHVKNIHGGRVEGLRPSKVKVFDIGKGGSSSSSSSSSTLSINVLSNLMPFFSFRESFKKIRLINKRMNQSFE